MVDAEGNVDEVEVGRGGIEMVYVVCSGSTLRHFQCWCGKQTAPARLPGDIV
jgi:hypothetical protein